MCLRCGVGLGWGRELATVEKINDDLKAIADRPGI